MEYPFPGIALLSNRRDIHQGQMQALLVMPCFKTRMCLDYQQQTLNQEQSEVLLNVL
jgi:hypothetical protein